MTRRRALILTKKFRYGYGGTPEAVFLFARALTGFGIDTDVYAEGAIIRDAGAFDDLPREPVGEYTTPINLELRDYNMLVIAGAWIFPALALALSARYRGLAVLYAPKGQLCRIEFSRLRDFRRVAYLALVEFWIPFLAHKIAFTSRIERSSSLLPGFLKARKGLVIPEMLDPARLPASASRDRTSGDPIRIGFIAQISPRKGLLELVEGFLNWVAGNPDTNVELVIAGTALAGSQNHFNQIQEMLRHHPSSHRVRFVGQVSGNERGAFYTSLDILIVPSKFESYCLTVLEALWVGKPVLAGPNLGVLEFLSNNQGVTTLNGISAQQIEAGITQVITNLPRLSEGAKAQAGLVPARLSGQTIVESTMCHLDIS